ncbi:hypothetical protein AQUCO_01100576v1 [Aquilegia coerulea]|uniref:SnoaL-like domain-containing protein n=1 Tax=Aquilegia coerulea TaxID=218851 RepID=A0A2G5E8B5_AQUCA|nr:hypothetical protein AQUCO_01100576v1 [Aquilegia coerulea]
MDTKLHTNNYSFKGAARKQFSTSNKSQKPFFCLIYSAPPLSLSSLSLSLSLPNFQLRIKSLNSHHLLSVSFETATGDAFDPHKFNNMSCINNFGTLCFSSSRFSKQHEFSTHNFSFTKRRGLFLPWGFSDTLITNYGKPTRHSLISHKYRQSVCCVKSEDSDGNLIGQGTILDEQTLERELQVAVEEENYAQAAKIRDSLRFLQEDSKAAVLAANARFYNCFREGDLAAMRALWAKRDNICCVHPGVSGISGYDYVMGSWDYVCAEYDFPLEIEVKDVEIFVKGDVGYVTCTETVKTKGTSNWGKQFATNVFERINGQWFICIHHASFVEL